MTVFANNEYNRVTHLRDLVVHLPGPETGYKHAGNEIWYYSPLPGDDRYTICENKAGVPENKNCSQTIALAISLDEHRVYLDMPISNFCIQYEPSNPLPNTTLFGPTTDEEFKETF